VSLRVIDVEKEDGAFTVDSAGSLEGVDGTFDDADQDSQDAADGTGDADAPATYDIYASEADPSTSRVAFWKPREGVCSFSSAHELMRERFAEAAPTGEKDDASPEGANLGRPVAVRVPTRVERDAEQEGAPVTDDEDRATNFGSAFHELAQCLVELGSGADDPLAVRLPDARIEATADLWRLSPRNRTRLRQALGRWSGSAVRAEALSHATVRAEVPFFSAADSEFGSYVEGAIDLLATDPGSREAFLVDYKTGDRGFTAAQIHERHEMQANFYASVLMAQGFEAVECRFVCVELEDADAPGEPFCARYRFDAGHRPRI
jgi:ATP-dependent exoDNAse (exonuclease V) beta subunit